jgi:acyl-CoA dehydrogenase
LVALAPQAGATRRYYKKLSRYASAFAFAADIALLTMGGGLKRKEMLSARFGDILSELYMLSATLKRWDEESRQDKDLLVVDYVLQDGFLTIERRLKRIIDNFPNRPAALLLRFFILPFGVVRRGPSDRLARAVAELLLEPSATRDRIAAGVFMGSAGDPIAKLEHALQLVADAQAAQDRLRQLDVRDWREARDQGILTEKEAAQLERADEAIASVIAVDDFAPEELTPRKTREAVARVVPAAAE